MKNLVRLIFNLVLWLAGIAISLWLIMVIVVLLQTLNNILF